MTNRINVMMELSEPKGLDALLGLIQRIGSGGVVVPLLNIEMGLSRNGSFVVEGTLTEYGERLPEEVKEQLRVVLTPQMDKIAEALKADGAITHYFDCGSETCEVHGKGAKADEGSGEQKAE